jgi:rod shape-determining protein MreD
MRRRRKKRQNPQLALKRYNSIVIVGSVVLCTILGLTRLPGMELMGIGPNWFVIWLSIWCLDRTLIQAILAGFCLGWIQDSLSAPWPSHTIGMVIVSMGFHFCFTHRFWKSDVLFLPLLVMGGVVINDGILSILFSLQDGQPILQVWQQRPQLFWISPLLSAIWTPAFFWPLRQWWAGFKPPQS